MICEGYDHPEDPYILAGSCGLEYNLELTQEGRERKTAAGQGWWKPIIIIIIIIMITI